jgi:transposase
VPGIRSSGLGASISAKRSRVDVGHRAASLRRHELSRFLPIHIRFLDLKSEAPRFKKRNISATIVADVKRFGHQIKRTRFSDTQGAIQRNLVERFFNKIKHFRAIATRYDKLAKNFLAAVRLVSAIILLN